MVIRKVRDLLCSLPLVDMDNNKTYILTDGAKAYIKLVELSLAMSSCFTADRVELWRKRGYPEPMPASFAPGYLLKYLTKEEREAISKLTSDEIRLLAMRPEFTRKWG